jgi:hypothetical protein
VPPARSAKDVPEGWPQVFNVPQIHWIDNHPAASNEESTPETISDTKHSHD